MKEYVQFKEKIGRHMEVLEETIRDLADLGAVNDASLARWARSLDAMKTSPRDSLLRVAVIGSVKSGKSTLMNSLLGRDLLRRGAGIITAFITRVRTDDTVGGWVQLKPWSHILEELNSSLCLVPAALEESGLRDPLDIRDPQDRARLQVCLDEMQGAWQEGRGRLDPNFILLKAYRDGYGLIGDQVRDDTVRLTFDEASVHQHQRYVGQESQAVYVQDMELRHPMPWLGDEVELADCQGSDSPNPLHLELLQHYLLRCHFILYVVNSRTGLREADFKLLDFIKTLRMFPQTSFVLNVDLDVHPHREDLLGLVERVRGELGWLVPNPRIFAFSALHSLLSQQGSGCSEREMRRLELWKEDTGQVEFIEDQCSAFRRHLVERISGQRTRLLVGSKLSRLSMVAASVMDTVHAQRVFMDEELLHLKTLASQLRTTQKALKGTLTTLENAISGLQESVRGQLDEAVDAALDINQGELVRETLDRVEQFPVDPMDTKPLRDMPQFMPQLYRFYMNFRQSMAGYLVERVNLGVIELAREQEALLHRRLTESSQAFWGLFDAALEDYRRGMARFKIELHPTATLRPPWCPNGPDRLSPPTFSAFVEKDALGRGVLLVKFGLGRMTRFLSVLRARLGKKEGHSRLPIQGAETIQEAVSLVKSEAKLELIQAFRDYGSSFKTQYLHEMLQQSTQHLLEEFRVRAEMTQLDFENVLKRSETEGEGRQVLKERLAHAWEVTHGMVEELGHFRCAVQLEWLWSGEEASPRVWERRDAVPS